MYTYIYIYYTYITYVHICLGSVFFNIISFASRYKGSAPPPPPLSGRASLLYFFVFKGNLECRSVLLGFGSWEGGGMSLKETRHFLKRFDKEIEVGGCRRSAVEKRWLSHVKKT